MKTKFRLIIFSLFPILLSACGSSPIQSGNDPTSLLPSHISTGEKTIVVDPRIHAWGAYDAQGQLVRSGIATAGGNYCPDVHRPCLTHTGSFRIQALGDENCKSSKYPVPTGGAPMPYCMFFNGDQSLHGGFEVVEDNVSHGCVRMEIEDAEWLRYNFVHIGTKVIIKHY